MTPGEVDNFKRKIEKETLDNVIKKVSVTDSYFYAEMVILKFHDAEDVFGGMKIKCIIKMNLFNSEEFKHDYLDNNRKVIGANPIRSEVILESEKLIEAKEDAMMIIYEEVGKQIAQDLFQKNAMNIHRAIHETNRMGRTYI